MGSANIQGNFLVKGGGEVLEAFKLLQGTYPNIELVVRSDVPKEIKIKYSRLDNLILEGTVPWDLLETDFKSADIFLYPSNSTPALAILDAMSYEIPVITTDVWGNSELVENERTGFVIKKSDLIDHYVGNLIPNWSSPTNLRKYSTPDPHVVSELVEKSIILIEDEYMRRRMGKAGRQEVEIGKFSLTRRNEKLKRIFDEATMVS